MTMRRGKFSPKWILFLTSAFWLALLPISPIISANAPAQNLESEQAQQHEVAVTLKLIQVYVTTKDGRPVADLEMSDFEVFDNGLPQNLTEFERHFLQLPKAEAKPQETPASPSNSISRMNRKFFLFFDFAFNDHAGILRSRKAALHFIDTSLQPEDEVGLISYSARQGMKIREYLTSDHGKVRRIVEGLEGNRFLGRSEDFEARYWQEFAAAAEAGGTAGRLGSAGEEIARMGQQAVEFDRNVYHLQVRHFSENLTDLGQALRYIPGEKFVILFSSGITNQVLYGKENISTSGYIGGQTGSAMLRDLYGRMARELANSSTSVYALNTAGKITSHFEDADMMGDRSLRQLSAASGGAYFDNITQYETIARDIQNSTGNYYVLGYYIDEQWDGKFHRVEVKVKRKDCRVRSQEGYYNPKPYHQLTDFEKELHLMDLAMSETPKFQKPWKFRATSIPFFWEERDQILLLSRLPMGQLKDAGSGKTEILLVVLGPDDDILSLKRSEADFSDVSAKDICLYSILTVPSGKCEARLVVINRETGRAGVSSCEISSAETRSSGFHLSPPLLLDTEGSSSYMSISSASGGDKARLPFLSAIFPFDVARFSPAVGEIAVGARKLGLLVHGSKDQGAPAGTMIKRISVQDESDQSISLSFIAVSQVVKDSAIAVLVEADLPSIPPGRYALTVTAEDAATQQSAQASTKFVILPEAEY
jgi:VWFA-related protein